MSEDHHHSEKNQGWLAPAHKNISGKNQMRAGLYLVGVPIGNMGDITLRALDSLAGADIIYCEDTRVTGKLLAYYGIKNKMISYNDYADDRARDAVLKHIEEGKICVLVSDAGMPMISDPGYKLVREALSKFFYVTSIPGANAALCGLQLSGLPTDRFMFCGFLPAKQKARQDALGGLLSIRATLVFYESGPRLTASLKDMTDVFGIRRGAVIREITKLYEERQADDLSALHAYYEERGAPKGEIVITVEGASEISMDDDAVKEALIISLKTMRTKEAAASVAALSGRRKNDIYQMALGLSEDT